jgi:hypothetical protein
MIIGASGMDAPFYFKASFFPVWLRFQVGW